MPKILINLVLVSTILLLPNPNGMIFGAESSTSMNGQTSSSTSTVINNGQASVQLNKYQTRSDSAPSTLSSSSSSSSPSSTSSLGNYYTNDLSSFLSSLPVISPSSNVVPSGSASIKSGPASTSNSANLLPYQALLQALAQSAVSTSAQSQQQQQLTTAPGTNSQAAANALVSSLLSAASTPSNAWMTLPASWSSALSNSNPSFMSMLRPLQPPIGGRRSSLTSRLRNIMNALFYRRETSSPMMTSGSSYSYSYRAPPSSYSFASPNSANEFNGYTPFSGYSTLYGGSPSYISNLYGGNGGSAANFVSERYPSANALYGSASTYRPSFVALPSSISMMNNGGGRPWSSDDRPVPGLYGKNYAYGGQQGPNYHTSSTQIYQSGPGSESSSYHQQTIMGNNQWSSPMSSNPSSNANSERSTSSAIWSSPLQNSNAYYQDNGSSYSESGRNEGSSYYPSSSFQTRISSSNPSSSSSSPQSTIIDRQSSIPSPTYVGPNTQSIKSALY